MSTNLYRALRELLPEPPLLVATVVAIHGSTESTVQFPGGEQQRVRGADVAVSGMAFIRNGVIEGAAPALTPETIDV